MRTKPSKRPLLGLILHDMLSFFLVVQDGMSGFMRNDRHRFDVSRRPRHFDQFLFVDA